MKLRTRSTATWASCLALATIAHVLHTASLGGSNPFLLAGEDDLELLLAGIPSLQRLLPPQRTIASDLDFLRLVQYIGTPRAQEQHWPQARALLERITDLDPEYGYAYEIGGILLLASKRIHASIEILEKGMRNVPQRWQLPFFASYDYWYELNDAAQGGALLLRASRLPGCPSWLAELAMRLYSSAGQFEPALHFVESALAENPPDAMKSELLRRRTELLVERDLRFLEKAIARYEQANGMKPIVLQNLVGSVLDRSVPTAPDGSFYSYDPTTGVVSSSLLPRRLQVYRPSQPIEAKAQ